MIEMSAKEETCHFEYTTMKSHGLTVLAFCRGRTGEVRGVSSLYMEAPIGTKGVAFCGAKGAICNGCEQLSESFQVMVAVHELGHNLGAL
eukprot:3996861-Amphidinium_carterae.1